MMEELIDSLKLYTKMNASLRRLIRPERLRRMNEHEEDLLNDLCGIINDMSSKMDIMKHGGLSNTVF